MKSLGDYLNDFKLKKYQEFETFYELTSDYIYLYLFISLNDYQLISQHFKEIYFHIVNKSKKFLKQKDYLENILLYVKKIIHKNQKKDSCQMEYIYKKNEVIEKDQELILIKIKSILSPAEKEFLLFKEFFKFKDEQMNKIFSLSLEQLKWIQTEIMIKIKSKVDLNKNKEIIETFINQLKEIKVPDICQEILEVLC